MIKLDSSHPHKEDLQATLDRLHFFDNPRLALDGYHFDGVYQQAVRDAGFRLLVIDDYAHQSEYHADLILNQNINAQQMKYRSDLDTGLLLGPDYALLRDQFLAWQGPNRVFPDKARRILVTLGGADPDNVTLLVIEALQTVDLQDLEITVVVGPANLHRDAVSSAAGRAPGKFRVLNNVTDMPALMAWADIAISGAGTTWCELAYMGLPSLLLVLADNQEDVATGMHVSGASINLGRPCKTSVELIVESTKTVLNDPELRRRMSEDSRRMVDGLGGKRTAQALFQKQAARTSNPGIGIATGLAPGGMD